MAVGEELRPLRKSGASGAVGDAVALLSIEVSKATLAAAGLDREIRKMREVHRPICVPQGPFYCRRLKPNGIFMNSNSPKNVVTAVFGMSFSSTGI